MLLDSGASSSFVDSAFYRVACRHGLPSATALPAVDAVTVALADGRTIVCQHTAVSTPIDLLGHPAALRTRVSLYVLPLQRQYDLILGKPWLEANNPRIDWPTNTVTIPRSDGPSYTLHTASNNVPQLPSLSAVDAATCSRISAKLLLAKAVLKAQRSGEQLFLAHVGLVSAAPLSSPSAPPPSDSWPPPHSNPAVRRLLAKYADVFPQTLPMQLPPQRPNDHRIPLMTDAPPLCLPTYRMSLTELDALRDHLKELLDHGFIRPSQSPYGAPVLFVKKKDGRLRLCVGYRALNKQTVRDAYPLPRIDEMLDRLQSAVSFSKLDLVSGYHQLRMHPADIPKTAFRTRYGHFQFTVLPFGLTGAPASFQRLMNTVFDTHLDQGVAVYLDDMIIYAPSVQQQLQRLRAALQLLRVHKLYAHRTKSEFVVDTIEFLGHTVSSGSLAVQRHHTKAVAAFPPPTNLTQLRSWLGMCNYYRRFVNGFAAIAAPLTCLTQKDVPYDWTATQQQAFEDLRAAITTAPVLALPDPALPFILTTDASAFAVGGVLSQAHPGGARPVAFASAKLSATQRRWPTYEKEAFAIFFCLQQWRHYLHGRATTVQTDHHSLAFLQSQTSLTAKQANWLQFIADNDFDLTFKYLPGKNNVVADALSRRPDLALAAVTAPQPAPTSPSRPAPAHPDPVSFLDPPPARRSQRPPAPRRHFADTTRTSLLPSNATPAPIRRGCYPAADAPAPSPPSPRRLPQPPSPRRRPTPTVMLPPELRPPHLSASPPPPLPASPQGSMRAASHAAPAAPRSSAPSATSSPNLLRPNHTPLDFGPAHDPPPPSQPPSSTHPLPAADLRQLIISGYCADPVYFTHPRCRADPDGAFYYRRRHQRLLCVPRDPAILSRIMFEHHDASYAGHLGVDKTHTSIARHFFWPNQRSSILAYIASCDACQRLKAANQPPFGLLHPLPIPERPWQSMSMDFLGPLPLTAARHDMIVVFVCRLTKYLVIRPTTTRATAEVIAAIFMSAVFADHGMPESIVSDRDARFTSRFWTAAMRTLGTRLNMSSPFHPQTDGQTERAIRSITQLLRNHVSEDLRDWDQHLSLVAYAYNNAVQASTGFTPFFLNNGRHPVTPSTLISAPTQSQLTPSPASAVRFLDQLRSTLAVARANIANAQRRQAAAANKHRRHAEFSVGQQVLLNTHHLRLPTGPQHKLRAKYCGPFIISHVYSPVSVRLRLPSTIRLHPTVHVSQIKPYDDSRTTTPATATATANAAQRDFYNIDAVLRRRTATYGRGSRDEVLVRWHGLQPLHDSWVPVAHLNRAARRIAVSFPVAVTHGRSPPVPTSS